MITVDTHHLSLRVPVAGQLYQLRAANAGGGSMFLRAQQVRRAAPHTEHSALRCPPAWTLTPAQRGALEPFPELLQAWDPALPFELPLRPLGGPRRAAPTRGPYDALARLLRQYYVTTWVDNRLTEQMQTQLIEAGLLHAGIQQSHLAVLTRGLPYLDRIDQPLLDATPALMETRGALRQTLAAALTRRQEALNWHLQLAGLRRAEQVARRVNLAGIRKPGLAARQLLLTAALDHNGQYLPQRAAL